MNRYCLFGSIAQLGEHLPYKQGVTGSSPVTSTIKQARAADRGPSMEWSLEERILRERR